MHRPLAAPLSRGIAVPRCRLLLSALPMRADLSLLPLSIVPIRPLATPNCFRHPAVEAAARICYISSSSRSVIAAASAASSDALPAAPIPEKQPLDLPKV